MELAKPFRALRPQAEHAGRVIAPPYDVVSTAEARALAADRPEHFLHVSRAEIDLPDGTDPHADAVYARAAANFARMRADGVLVRDAQPSLYIYRLASATHTQTGIAVTASIAAYNAGRIRRHELTRPDKETDRVRHIDALNAQTGPVLCAYRTNPRLTGLIAEAARGAPLLSATDAGGVLHTIWQISTPADVARLAAAANALDALYIADGHHRSAAAARVAAARHADAAAPASHDYFLTVAFPEEALEILDYNRVVADLNGAAPAEFLRRIDAVFDRREVGPGYKPAATHRFGMYIDGRWFELTLRAPLETSDPVARLDVSLLHGKLIEPLLGVHDPRSDPRIDFVGGSRGLAALEARVDAGTAAVAFALDPTPIGELIAVADAGRLMPPKSTWFEPKLADGLIAHVLD
jgi:uncharacterized protein (DUF1015 family)